MPQRSPSLNNRPSAQPFQGLVRCNCRGNFRGNFRVGVRGFTLIELLVVISIIALLIAILLPALRMARKTGWAVNSLSNMRSWGQGTHLFLNDSKFILPWEGDKLLASTNFNDKDWWANVVPPYVGQPRYRDLYVGRRLAGLPVPQPPDKNIFVDPSAEIGPEQVKGIPLSSISYYFSYVVNADLAEGDKKMLVRVNNHLRVKYDSIRAVSCTVLMFELRAAGAELSFLKPTNPGYYEQFETDQLRMKGDEKHFAGRHFEGGHIAFADGHAAHVRWLDAYTGVPSVRWEGNTENFNGD